MSVEKQEELSRQTRKLVITPDPDNPQLSIIVPGNFKFKRSGIKAPLKHEYDILDDARGTEQTFINLLSNWLKDQNLKFDGVCGVLRGGLRFSLPLAEKFNVYHIAAHPDETFRAVDIPPKETGPKQVVLIDDHQTLSTSADIIIERLKRNFGIDVIQVLTVSSYGLIEQFPEFRKWGIPYFSLAPFHRTLKDKDFRNKFAPHIPVFEDWYQDLLNLAAKRARQRSISHR